MSWLSQALHSLENAAVAALAGLEADGKALFVKLEPILKSDVAALINDVVPIAENAIGIYAATGTLTNEQRNAAIAQTEADAKAVGISASASVLNAAVAIAELSATALASSGGSAPASTAAPVEAPASPAAASNG
jgi:hypothetical protein